tara:strand:+ start:1720 stop:3003 length:1284 start_codon:yes stop_codon:yes gene_type:complete
MPDNESRIHKINGNNGELIWSTTIENTVGFGISEINDNNRVDYIVCGGIGSSQERWIARLNGENGSIVWNRTYNINQGNNMFDGVRTTIVGSDGYIYGSGFVGGDESNTIFVVYGGSAMVIKVNPDNGNEVWTHINDQTEYAMSMVESSNGSFFYGSTNYDENLTLTKINSNGTETWTRQLAGTDSVIPADLDITNEDIIFYGGHSYRDGNGEPFDYTSIRVDLEGNIDWIKNYAGPRGYNLEYIRNELYGIKTIENGVYLFGGTGDEDESYSEDSSVYESSDVWNGWVLFTDLNGNIIRSDVFCHNNVNTATEYGDITEDGYMIFNDTDAFGDTEVGVMKILNPSLSKNDILGDHNTFLYPNPTSSYINLDVNKNYQIVVCDMLGNKIFSQFGNKINIEHLPSATYIVSITDKDNDEKLIYKVIKN